jgi:hypothetical protein
MLSLVDQKKRLVLVLELVLVLVLELALVVVDTDVLGGANVAVVPKHWDGVTL